MDLQKSFIAVLHVLAGVSRVSTRKGSAKPTRLHIAADRPAAALCGALLSVAAWGDAGSVAGTASATEPVGTSEQADAAIDVAVARYAGTPLTEGHSG